MAIQQPSPQSVPDQRVIVAEQARYNFRAAAAVGFIVGVIDVLIAGRFLLKLLGASAQSSFVSFISGLSSPLLAPFHGIFPNSGSATNIFEPASLVAIGVYALIGWGAVVLIRITTAPRGTKPAAS
jgi:hypothetical protein